MLYAAQFSKEGQGRFIAAGGSGLNEAKVFDTQRSYATVGAVVGLPRGVFALDFAPMGEEGGGGGAQKLAIAGGDCSIRILDIVSRY